MLHSEIYLECSWLYLSIWAQLEHFQILILKLTLTSDDFKSSYIIYLAWIAVKF